MTQQVIAHFEVNIYHNDLVPNNDTLLEDSISTLSDHDNEPVLQLPIKNFKSMKKYFQENKKLDYLPIESKRIDFDEFVFEDDNCLFLPIKKY